MTTNEALKSLGVEKYLLTPTQSSGLDQDGFLVLPNILSTAQVAAVNARLDELLNDEGGRAGMEGEQESGAERLSDLVNKGEVFKVFYTHPQVLAGLAHVLGGEMKLSSLNARFAKPGEGGQALHADWGRLETPGEWQVCNSIWLLDDFTLHNGATRVVGGSHLRGDELPSDSMADTTAAHPEEELLLAPAGTVVIFNSHVWHGGTLNTTALRRRAMHSYWTRRNQPPQLEQQAYLQPETNARLSDAERFLLDVHGPANA